MSIINNAHAGSQINLLCLIYRVLHRNDGNLSVEEITHLCKPLRLPDTKNAEKRFTENLNFWMKESSHQLWAENSDGKLELIKKIASPTPYNIAKAVSEVLFSAGIQDVFAKSSNEGIEQLFLSLSCILASGRFTFDSRESIDSKTLDQLFSECLGIKAPNDSEKPVINEYGHFLGYLEPIKSGFYVDPTRIVQQMLSVVFADSKELGALDFLKRLASCSPLLDGGEYRQQVESRMTKYVSSDPNAVSKPLSLAIKRLSMAGILALDVRSDDVSAYRLQLPGNDQAFSSIEYRVGGGRL